MRVEDEYVRRQRAGSILCLPLVKQGKLIGVLYLEDNLASQVFTTKRLVMLETLASQAAIALRKCAIVCRADARKHRTEAGREEVASKGSFLSEAELAHVSRGNDHARIGGVHCLRSQAASALAPASDRVSLLPSRALSRR